MTMTLVVKCVICGEIIERPLMSQLICRNKECQKKYQAFLVWDERQKAKVNKVLKITKIKEDNGIK